MDKLRRRLEGGLATWPGHPHGQTWDGAGDPSGWFQKPQGTEGGGEKGHRFGGCK